jgi:UDP-N-acetylglucosamine--dolichyl-phosphate N-acetylglucosaminephosphotransferase
MELSSSIGPSLVAFFLSSISTFVLIPPTASFLRRKGIVGIDVHKASKPEIPEMVGITFPICLALSLLGALFLAPQEAFRCMLSFYLTVLIVALVGILDDLKGLGPKAKPLLTALGGLPILFLGYNPRPILPFVGATRLHYVYPLAIPLAIAVTSNAMNMADPVNGCMSGSSSIIFLTLALASLALGREDALLLACASLGYALVLFYYNRYPARVFTGDVGSLSIGAAIGAIAILGRMEIVAIVAMMPQIMNAFTILTSVGRLFERKELSERPTRLSSDNRIYASTSRRAPITLTRMILAAKPMEERELALEFFKLTAFSSILALLTALLMEA